MIQNLKKRTEGFTIIEVMIVLVIAAVILLIVFLAVPALQRNSRNTQRKNDVATYAAAVNEWAGNNNGNLPTVAADLTTANTGVNALANSGFLAEPTTIQTGARTAAVAIANMEYVQGAQCDTATVGNTVAAAARQFAIRYATENSAGGAIPQCQNG